MTRGFWRTGRGVEAHLSDVEATLLRDLAGQVLALLRAPDRQDPVVARLFPDAHRDDAGVAAEFRELAEDDLRAGKAAGARMIVEALPRGGRLVLAEPDAEQWLAALNDIRLALGTRLDVTEETYEELDDLDAAADPEDPRIQGLRVYDWLSGLQETLVRALSG